MAEQTQPPALDPAELAKAYGDIVQRSSQLMTDYIKRQSTSAPSAFGDELGIAKAFFDMTAKMFANPTQMAEMQLKLWQDYMSLWQNSMMHLFGQQTQPVIEPAKGDRRFKHDDWQQNFLFDYIKQSYLIAAKHMHGAVGSVQGLDEHTAKKVDFYTRQFIDALAPSNFALTNPEVLRETVASGGQNLVKGLSNLLEDLESGDGKQVRVKMTDASAFEVGGNLAATPGKVVYQNKLMQLVQYAPLTTEVYRRPLLILPPWINKFYILDMREKNSFVRWATEQGHTVFIASWVNPDATYAKKTFDDYMLDGPLAALDAIEKATGEREVDAVGFCLGGTLLASALGYMAAKNVDRIKSATFLASMIDFAEPGELEIFIDDKQVASLEKKMLERGYLEGAEMATTFNMLRANDLIWSFVVNNYLLGKAPFPFDLLYWNSDSTRMPAAMHSFYLRNMYIKNLLKQPGGITLNDVPIDLGKVKVPMYFASTIEDHIAPWKSTYAGAKLFKSKVRFVLGGSGHIAGIVNPPAANKYGYWTNGELAATPQAWFDTATQHPGSWWTDWAAWVKHHAGDKVPARVPGKGKLKAIEDAPGSYVKLRLDAKKATA
ncbi:MAG: class poly(R)-hydroxyalkanoic acid synthase [Betaproteobacteria bacterium]|nr:class poly(R)-hydroxyalkanoic acid synthase [Betaproteobacteria bacterium]